MYTVNERKSTFPKLPLECEWEIHQRPTLLYLRAMGFNQVEIEFDCALEENVLVNDETICGEHNKDSKGDIQK